MDSRININVMLTIACLAAISIVATTTYYRRKLAKKACSRCCPDWETKPQNGFKRLLSDNSYSPFKHLKWEGENENTQRHPYEEEITQLLEHPSFPLDFIVNQERPGMIDSYIWVDKVTQLELLANVLSKENVFAVDTEQHSLRTFLGFTSLMQISTQKEDYLLDTIALHDEMDVLRPVFANPSICKVFHGADNDILWLQRDFHIYVVNLFDTAKACEVIPKPHKSLAYLLETYCGVFTNKMLQCEDWRQRPLSKEMTQYARADVHYLLSIAYFLVLELKMKGNDYPDDQLKHVFEASRRSNMLCLQLYVKEKEAFPGASSIFSKHLNGQGILLLKSTKTLDLVRKLCTWRDLMARIHDESLRYVLSDQAIGALAVEVPKTPTEMHWIISNADVNLDSSNVTSFIPSPSPSPITHSHLMEFLDLIQKYPDNDIDEICPLILEKHLGPDGSCMLSAFNFSLSSKSYSKFSKCLTFKQNGGKHMKQTERKNSRELFVRKFSCKSPVYHNCRIYANDGRLLCYCDRRKLEWYLSRNLAKLIDDEPPAVMLLFEPKGRPEDADNEFYIQSKKNVCVGCGEQNHYLRYRIIPSCYRIHFPEHLKSHRSHDIVLLCVDCHEIAHSAAEKYKKNVAAEFGIPLFIRSIVATGQKQVAMDRNFEEAGVSPLQLRTAAMALLRHGSRMPSERHDELIQIVRAYFGGREISDEDLERALLVGMGAQEMRRIQKKRGLSVKKLSGSIISNNSEKLSTDIVSLCPILVSGDQTKNTDYFCANVEVSKVENISSLTDETEGYISTSRTMDSSFNSSSKKTQMISSQENDKILDPCGYNSVSKEPLDATISLDSSAESNYAQKLSLLGHGPHGKKVVEHLLRERGEDGIRQFCQRWRKVFVEAINPRHLPNGWDIMHSGRREFGEFSVYNSASKGLHADVFK